MLSVIIGDNVALLMSMLVMWLHMGLMLVNIVLT